MDTGLRRNCSLVPCGGVSHSVCEPSGVRLWCRQLLSGHVAGAEYDVVRVVYAHQWLCTRGRGSVVAKGCDQ